MSFEPCNGLLLAKLLNKNIENFDFITSTLIPLFSLTCHYVIHIYNIVTSILKFCSFLIRFARDNCLKKYCHTL